MQHRGWPGVLHRLFVQGQGWCQPSVKMRLTEVVFFPSHVWGNSSFSKGEFPVSDQVISREEEEKE